MVLTALTLADGVLPIISAIKNSIILTSLGCTQREIFAAQLELENTIANILLSSPVTGGDAEGTSSINSVAGDIFTSHPTDIFVLLQERYLVKSAGAPGDAAISNAFARRAIYTAVLSDDEGALQKFLVNLSSLNTDIVLAALNCVPMAMKNRYSLKSLSEISRTYVMLLDIATNPEICARICYELADVLDRVCLLVQESGSHRSVAMGLSDLDLDTAMRKLSSALGGTGSPSLSNAHIRMSGFILIHKQASRGPPQVSKETWELQMTAWGKLLWEAGNDNNVSI